jgi:hypothetical protein
MNFYLRPSRDGATALPKDDVFFTTGKHPVEESSMIIRASDKSFSTAEYFSKHNVFGLMQNDGELKLKKFS